MFLRKLTEKMFLRGLTIVAIQMHSCQNIFFYPNEVLILNKKRHFYANIFEKVMGFQNSSGLTLCTLYIKTTDNIGNLSRNYQSKLS